MSASRMGTVLRLLGIGWYVALSIVGGVIGGYLLGRWLGFGPLFTLAGLGLGLSIAIGGMYRMLLNVLDKSSDSNGASLG